MGMSQHVCVAEAMIGEESDRHEVTGQITAADSPRSVLGTQSVVRCRLAKAIMMSLALCATACSDEKDTASGEGPEKTRKAAAFQTDSETVASFMRKYEALPLGNVSELTFTIDWQRQLAGRNVVVAAKVEDVLQLKNITALLSSFDTYLLADSALSKRLSMEKEWMGSFSVREPALLDELRRLANPYKVIGPLGIFAVRIDSVAARLSNVQYDSDGERDLLQSSNYRVMFGELLAVRRMESGFDLFFLPPKERASDTASGNGVRHEQ